MAPAIRNRSFFSATITSAKVLNRMRNMLLDWQAEATEEVVNVNTGQITTVYKETGLAKFREKSAEFLIQEGLATPEDYQDQRITNVISNSRLQLIYNTNLEQASTFAQWQGRMRNEGWLNLNPAARFVRRPGARIKRQRHVEAEGDVRRWDDFAYWQFQNAADIGGFDVPWGPFGFNSYMIQEPVKRAESERRGLVRKGERVKAPSVSQFGVDLGKQFNSGVEAQIDDVTPELQAEARQTIIDRLGPQAIGADGRPTLDALKQALSGNYKPITSPAPMITPSRTFEEIADKLKIEGLAAKKIVTDIESLADKRSAAHARLVAYDGGDAEEKSRLSDAFWDLSSQWKVKWKAQYDDIEASIERAREIVSIPASERGQLQIRYDYGGKQIKDHPTVVDGIKIVERYTSKGLLPKVYLGKLKDGERAFARPEDPSGAIFVAKDSGSSVFAHEVTHITEVQSGLLDKAKNFLAKRAEGEPPRSLKELTGIDQYEDYEVAYKDKWVEKGGNDYSGKVYSDATEILTMGIERLHANPAKFYETDPEYFEFVIRTIQQL
jgi:hypothetical protein